VSVHRIAALLWIVAVVAGCGASKSANTSAATAAHAKRELIAQPCAQLPADGDAGEGGCGRVFIQAAQVLSSDLQQPLGPFLIDHPVGISSVVSFMGDNTVPATVSWNRCSRRAIRNQSSWT
jgi:hypothetical protein